MTVELCRLSDGKVSVRLDGTEVVILPKRNECTIGDLEEVFNKVLDQAEGGEW